MKTRAEELNALILDVTTDIDIMLLKCRNGSATCDRDKIWDLIEKRTEYQIELSKIGD